MRTPRLRFLPNETLEWLIAAPGPIHDVLDANDRVNQSSISAIRGAVLQFAGKIALGEQVFEQLMVDFQLGTSFSLIGQREHVSAGEACRRRRFQLQQIRIAFETASALCEVRVRDGLIVSQFDV